LVCDGREKQGDNKPIAENACFIEALETVLAVVASP